MEIKYWIVLLWWAFCFACFFYRSEPVTAAPNTYELEMRRVKALEAIASGVCFGKPTRQCMPFTTQGDENAARLHAAP